jgi:hypothetical protein
MAYTMNRALILTVILGAAQPALAQVSVAQVSVSPAYRQIVPGQSVQFAATGGPVVWQVDNVTGGTAQVGTITPGGLYTAPTTLVSPAAVTVTAVGTSSGPALPPQSATTTLTLLAALPTGLTYYVAPTGSDANPGTRAAPFLTLQHAAAIAQAGDTVLARQGVYNGLLTPPRSGDGVHGPITFASYPGELATIDGTGLPIPGGQNGLVTLNGVSNVIVEGFELRNYTTAKLTEVPVGIYITGAGTRDQIVNNHIHDITTTGHTTPEKCGSDALGMAVYGTQAPDSINALVISGNEIDHLLTGCSESMSIDGNVDGYLVAGNIVHDNDNIGIDSIGFEKVSPDPVYDQARNGEIRGNLVYNITSYGNPDYGKQYAADGIYVDGGTNIVIEQNTVTATDLGIELASEHRGRLTSYVTARNNLVYANNSNGISIGGYGRLRGGSDHVTIVNNTLFHNDTKNTGSGEFQIQWNATNNLFQNNVVVATAQNLFVHNYTPTGADAATLNDNLYFAAAGAAAAQFEWNHTLYKSFASYRAATGQDAQSLFADPEFQNAAALDFDIQPGSPAFTAGADLGASVIGTVDFAGNPRTTGVAVTIGAYQE